MISTQADDDSGDSEGPADEVAVVMISGSEVTVGFRLWGLT
jgi:hypothetical protein